MKLHINNDESKFISIIGSGYVGTQVGKGLQQLGHSVIFCDIQKKELPNFTFDISEAISVSEVSFVCLPTPSKNNGEIDISFLHNGLESIGRTLGDKGKYHLMVIKSTIVPGITDSFIIPLLEKASGKKAGKDFGLCVNPEFITKLSSSWCDDPSFVRTFFNEDSVIIGSNDDRSGDMLEDVYKPVNIPVWRVDIKTAEMIKYAANCMLATKISYWNEIFLLCQEMGIDSQKVAEAAGTDPRIGKYGTVNGKAFGGDCLPKDLKAFIHMADRYHDPVLLHAVDFINEKMKKMYGVRD